MRGYFLKNNKGEYLKELDTAQGKISFTNDFKEAYNYIGRPGGGAWDADNEKLFIKFHFGEEYGDRVNTLSVCSHEW